MTTAELMAKMKARFCMPEWILLTEIRNLQEHRRADAIAINRYNSKRFEIWGLEVKVSRSDLMAELRDITKWEAFGLYCDRFWLICASKDIIDGVTLPAAWGVFVAHGDSIRQIKPAVRTEPRAMPRSMLSDIIYNLYDAAPTHEVIRTAYEKGKLDGIEQRNAQLFSENYNTQQRIKQVDEFEKTSGIKIDQWNGRRIGEELKRFIDVNYAVERFERDLKDCQKKAQTAADYLKKVMDKTNGEANEDE